MFSEYPDVVSVEDLCVMLSIGKNTAYNLLHEQQIESVRVGRQFRIPKLSVERYLLRPQNCETGKTMIG